MYNKAKKWMPWVILTVLLVYYVYWMIAKTPNWINSDEASELVLSKILSQRGGILSKDWFYSTELRVLNTQIVFAPLFWLTDSWYAVRVVGTLILNGILAVSAVYMCLQLGIRQYMGYVMAALFLPLSSTWHYIVMSGAYYIPHIAISFLTLGLCVKFCRTENWIKRIVILILTCLLGIGAGMGGLRQLIVLYIPLAISALAVFVFDRHRSRLTLAFLVIAVLTTASSWIGYKINEKVLCNDYSFKQYTNISFTSVTPSRIWEVINGWLKLLGYRTGEVFSYVMWTNLVCVVLLGLVLTGMVMLIRKYFQLSFEQQVLGTFLLGGVIVFFALYACSDMEYYAKYLIPVFAFVFPFLFSILPSNIKMPEKYKFLFIILLFGMFLCAKYSYADTEEINNEEIFEIVSRAEEYGCMSGYSTFWQGNVLTEISSGKIDMRVINTWKSDVISIDNLMPWLQDKNHWDTLPQGRFFVLFTKGELGWTAAQKIIAIDPPVIYESDRYIAYLFENHDSFQQMFDAATEGD